GKIGFWILDFRFCNGQKLASANLKSKIQNLKSERRVTSDECGLTSRDGVPGTNGATSKTRCGTGMYTSAPTLQAGFLEAYPSTMSSLNSFCDEDIFGK